MINIKTNWGKIIDKFKRVQTIPPLLYPIVVVFWVIAFIVSLFTLLLAGVGGVLYLIIFRFPLWIIGYWWCKKCDNRFWIYDDKQYVDGEYNVISDGYDQDKVCKSCYNKHYEEKKKGWHR